MLGDRYGFRPPPPEIPAHEFEMLRKEADHIGHPHVDLLDTWFKKDENAVPALYVMQVPLNTCTMICLYIVQTKSFEDFHQFSIFQWEFRNLHLDLQSCLFSIC